MSTKQFAEMTDADAESFMPVPEIQPVRAKMAQIVGSKTVIDIGCGRGDEVEALFDQHTYFGIDCSASLVRMARARNPGFRFALMAAQGVQGHWDYAIIKAVLEHVPREEAVAIYDHARTLCDTLLVAWHTEPGIENLTWYDGELGRMQQNRHDRSLFGGSVTREVCGKHVLWTVV